MKWTQEKNSWLAGDKRITKVGIEGDELRYLAYSDGNYLGSENTFNDARKLAISGKIKESAVRDETDGIPDFVRLTGEERKEAWSKNPPVAWNEPKKVDAATQKFLDEQAAAKEAEKKAKFARLKEEHARVPKRPSRDGLIDVATIAKEFDIEPGEARAILRKAKVVKPAAGWAGDKAWADGIRKIIKKAIKQEMKG